MQPHEERVLDAIDRDALLRDLAELVAERSLGGRENGAQQKAAAQMAAPGLDVDTWTIDVKGLSSHPAYSAEIERTSGLGVVGALHGNGDGPRLILNGHVDVVPVGDEDGWSVPPWEATLKDGRVYGRGSCDMKGGLVCAVAAARAIHDAGVRLRGRLLVQSVIGEEDGGCGTLATILRRYRADGAVIMEPTNLQVVAAQAGAMNFRLRVPGRSAHACVRREGVSAIERFWGVHQALLEHEAEKNAHVDHPLYVGQDLPWPLSVGTLRAGDWPSSVPEELVAEGRYGVAIGEDMEDARRTFEDVVARAAASDSWLRDHPPSVEWWGGQFAPAETPTDAPVVTAVRQAFADATGGAPPEVVGVPYGADMRLLVLEGRIPTVMFGPGDVRRAHTADEYVPVADLEAVTRTLALTVMRFCGTEPG